MHTRELFVMSEVALSLVLLISVGLLLESFMRLENVNPSFEAKNLLAMRLSLSPSNYRQRDPVVHFYDKYVARLRSLPGVQSVGTISALPLTSTWAATDFTIAGRPPLTSAEVPSGQYRSASTGYSRAMKIPLLAGRQFTDEDIGNTRSVAVISEALARRYWPEQSSLGSHLVIQNGRAPYEVEIFGVVGNVKHFGLNAEATADLYIPLTQISPEWVPYLANTMYWVVRTGGDPLALTTVARRELAAVDREVAASSTQSMEQFVAASVGPRRFQLLLLEILAAAALLLAAIGLYGVMACAVSSRTREIGIRMALGAQPREMFRLVLGQGLRLILWGLGIGVLASLAATRLLSSLIFGVSATDPSTFVGVAMLLAAVGLLAAYLPPAVPRASIRLSPFAMNKFSAISSQAIQNSKQRSRNAVPSFGPPEYESPITTP